MKVSVNWLRKYAPIELPINELVDKIGAQLGAIEEVVNLGERYQGILVARVASCQKHPNADKLSICWIDDGGKQPDVARNEQGLIHIVCGAPNVAEGQLVAWLPPGVIVPATYDKDPLKLESREIRGEMSNGMLASPKELAIGDTHQGILIIDKPANPGDDFAKLYELDDYIIDIENKMFTHRPDCFGMLGVAREVAGICGKSFKSPLQYLDVNLLDPQINLELNVFNNAQAQVPRFMAQVFGNISVGDSSVALQTYLSRCGVKPINNIVDLTNYFMLLTGQPLHAYDYDKLAAIAKDEVSIGTRLAKAGEEIKLLNGKTLKVDADAVMIVAGDHPIGLGGVMGGSETEVDASTKNIILECATFDMNLTRKTAMKYGLFTDAVTRYTKGQSPLQNDHIVSWVAGELVALGATAGKAYDIKSDLSDNRAVEASKDFVNQTLGLELGAQDMATLLQNVEFGVDINNETLIVTPPFWRTDIEIAEDITEEVGRLYGYDKLKLKLPLRSIKPTVLDDELLLKSAIRGYLASFGANEVLTYSFVPKSLLDKVGQDASTALHIRNALSPSLQHYRLSLAPSLLEKVHSNIKAGYDEFAIFELGRVHIKEVLDAEKLPKEIKRLALIYADKNKSDQAAYFKASRLLSDLLYKFGLYGASFGPLKDFSAEWATAAQPFEPSRSAGVYWEGNLLGIIGEPTAATIANLKLPINTSMFELDLEQIKKLALGPVYRPLNKFPSIKQDICLRVATATTYQDLVEAIKAVLSQAEKQQGYKWEIEALDIYQSDDNKDLKQITWRIEISHPQRTLVSDEVNKLFDMIAEAAKGKFNAERV